jgi:hypothetical protein
MNRSKRILNVILALLVFHCSTIGYGEKVTASAGGHHDETYFALTSPQGYSAVSKNENYRVVFNNNDSFFAPVFLPTLYRVTDVVLTEKLTDRLQLCREHSVRLESTEIVFPFHHFL